jgi:hypothetical protein
MSEAAVRFVSFLECEGPPGRVELKVRELARTGMRLGTVAGFPIVVHEDVPPGVVYLVRQGKEPNAD